MRKLRLVPNRVCQTEVSGCDVKLRATLRLRLQNQNSKRKPFEHLSSLLRGYDKMLREIRDDEGIS